MPPGPAPLPAPRIGGDCTASITIESMQILRGMVSLRDDWELQYRFGAGFPYLNQPQGWHVLNNNGAYYRGGGGSTFAIGQRIFSSTIPKGGNFNIDIDLRVFRIGLIVNDVGTGRYVASIPCPNGTHLERRVSVDITVPAALRNGLVRVWFLIGLDDP
jgi:hypothetical protein